jgi:hypothetical protein
LTKRTGANYVISGFGNQNADAGGSSNPSNVLKYAQQTFVSRATCQAAATQFTLPATALCSGPIPGQSGTDTCQGDVSNLLFCFGGFVEACFAVWRPVGCECERVLFSGGSDVDGNVDRRGRTAHLRGCGSVWSLCECGGDEPVDHRRHERVSCCGVSDTSWYRKCGSHSRSFDWSSNVREEKKRLAQLFLMGLICRYVYIIIGVVGGLVVLLIIICCCCRCHRNSDSRRHQAAVRAANNNNNNNNKPSSGPPRPVSPQPNNNGGEERKQVLLCSLTFVSGPPVVVNYAPAAATNRPPVRPELRALAVLSVSCSHSSSTRYALPMNPSYGIPLDPAVSQAPPPPQQQRESTLVVFDLISDFGLSLKNSTLQCRLTLSRQCTPPQCTGKKRWSFPAI